MVFSFEVHGVNVCKVEIQLQVSKGIPGISIVGTGNRTVQESKERVRGCLSFLDIKIPPKKFLFNLTPANLVKSGSHYDFGILVALLFHMNIIDIPQDVYVIGEIGVDGKIFIDGNWLPVIIYCGKHNIYLIGPSSLEKMISLVLNVYPNYDNYILVQSVSDLINRKYIHNIKPIQLPTDNRKPEHYDTFHPLGIRAIECGIAGGHHTLFVGPPGIGKSVLMRIAHYLMPPLLTEQIIENLSITNNYNILYNDDIGNINIPPCREIHNSISDAGMFGGGTGHTNPGEISLASNGLLIVNEIAEYSQNFLDKLRQPMEDRYITISRSLSQVTYPAKFQLMATMNPCKCGFYGSTKKTCRCSFQNVMQYQRKISGPMIDRFDICVFTSETDHMVKIDLENMKYRIQTAQNLQRNRNGNLNSLQFDDSLFNIQNENIIQTLKTKYSPRFIHKVKILSRTIADLDGKVDIHNDHILEAISLRLYCVDL